MSLQILLQQGLPYLSHYGLVIVFAGALLEGETVILLAGVLCHRGVLPLDWTVMVAAVGAFAGDQIWFHLGHRFGPVALTYFPRLAKHADEIRPWFDQKSDWIALGSRFIYGSRTVAPLLLGMHDYPATRFALINILSASLWAVAVVAAGYLIGAGAEQLFGRIEHIEQLLLAVFLIMLFRWWYRHRKR